VSFTGAPATATESTPFTVTATSNETGSDATTPTITTTGPCLAGPVTGSGGTYQATITITKSSGTCSMTAKWATTPAYEGETLKQVTTAN
jgi:hypothetical protein